MKCGLATTSSTRLWSNIRPARITGLSTVWAASALASGKPMSTPSIPSTEAP
jgi:hypothetical protein